MAALGINGSECSLLGWPSFDEFVWSSCLGELDLQESVSRPVGTSTQGECNIFNEYMPSDIATKEGSASPKILQQKDATRGLTTESKNRDPIHKALCFPLPQVDFPAASAWDAMEASDIESILDLTFPCVSTPPMTSDQELEDSEDFYGLYSNDMMLIQDDRGEHECGDEFMEDPIIEADVSTTTSNNIFVNSVNTARQECTMQNQEEARMKNNLPVCHGKTIGKMEEVGEIFEQYSLGEVLDESVTSMPLLSSSCNSPSDSVSQTKNRVLGESKGKMDPVGHILPVVRGNYDLGTSAQCLNALASKPGDAIQQLCTEPGIWQQWQTSRTLPEGMVGFDRKKSSIPISDETKNEYTSIPSKKRRSENLAWISYDNKVNKAQASRARRLAASHRRAEGRAKKQFPYRKSFHEVSQSNPLSSRGKGHQGLSLRMPLLSPLLNTSVQCFLPTATVSLPRSVQGEIHSTPVNSFEGYIHPSLQQNSTATISLHQNYPLTINHGHMVPSILHQQQQPGPQGETLMDPLGKRSDAITRQRAVQHAHFPSAPLLYHNRQQHLLAQNGDGQPQQPGPMKLFDAECKISTKPVVNPEVEKHDQTLEASVLQQLGSIVSQLSMQMRLCIRDALFRLAKSAKERQAEICGGIVSTEDIESTTSSSPNELSSVGLLETKTNPIDRQIASLLFCKHFSSFQSRCAEVQTSGTVLNGISEVSMQLGSRPIWNFNRNFVHSQDMSVHTY